MEGYKELRFFKPADNDEGILTVIEKSHNLPFPVKRIFYICGAPAGLVRGRHAHRKLKQILFCPSGSCDFILDDGHERRTIEVRTPDHGIYIYGHIWVEFTNFSPNCVVMSLASAEYDESDYIRDYDEFLHFVGRND
jgi:dTDP-4-dehydrorhamnose 3,5-epimerase-like enzyme